MNHNRIIISLLIGLLVLPAGILAQDDSCPTIVQNALAAAETGCVETGRNQAAGETFAIESPSHAVETLEDDLCLFTFSYTLISAAGE